MENVLYRGIIIPAGKAADGETPTSVIVTREANGVAIWRESCEEGLTCVKHEMYARDDAYIEEAVGMVQRERALVAKAA